MVKVIVSVWAYRLICLCFFARLSVEFVHWWISAGRVYISGWKRDQTDPCVLCARLASARTKLYHCMGVGMQISRIHGLYYEFFFSTSSVKTFGAFE